MMLSKDAIVTVCHSNVDNLGTFTKQADILISAANIPNLITY